MDEGVGFSAALLRWSITCCDSFSPAGTMNASTTNLLRRVVRFGTQTWAPRAAVATNKAPRSRTLSNSFVRPFPPFISLLS